MTKRRIVRADILPLAQYAEERKQRRQAMLALKRPRRVEIGPVATFHFENYATMWMQVHEMLLIEKGGEAQIPGELEAYNSLIPQGRELVATIMFEIDDAARRAAFLARIGGIEATVFMEVDGETVMGRAEEDTDRTSAEGKASSVQFVHFPFADGQARKFRTPNARVLLGFKHPDYAHMAVLPEATRAALAGDFD